MANAGEPKLNLNCQLLSMPTPASEACRAGEGSGGDQEPTGDSHEALGQPDQEGAEDVDEGRRPAVKVLPFPCAAR